MNYLGAESASYQLRTHKFLGNMEFILDCPLFPYGIPRGKETIGIFIFFDPESGQLNQL